MFVIVFAILFILSICLFDIGSTFSKEKMPTLKALMAIIIVLGHLSTRVTTGWIQPFRFWGAPFVSMFLFISGYGMWQNSESHSGLSFLLTLKRVWRILLPYMLTVLLYFLIVRIPSHETLTDIREIIATGTSNQSHLWFVFAIIYLYFAFYCCTRLKNKVHAVALLFAVVAATIVLLRGVGYDRCWYVSLLAFPTGCLYSMNKEQINRVVFRSRWTYTLAILLAVAGVGLTYLTRVEVLYSVSHIFIPIAMALILIQLPYERFNNRLTKHLGAVSYEIYLCQMIAMDALPLFFPELRPGAYIFLALAVTLLLAEFEGIILDKLKMISKL